MNAISKIWTWFSSLPNWVRIILFVPIAIVIVGAIVWAVIRGRWIGNIIGGGLSAGGGGTQRLEAGLRKLEENQRSAAERIDDIAARGAAIEAGHQLLEEGQHSASGVIESATARVGRLEKLLGIKPKL